ncbi:MAG: type I methionyl aminopeptidase [Candidatus Zambryskibacteria bacterium]|nr:type I methionyl aminopeptidase [Candidatus Zambryskibacteria bacterium]
MIRIKKPEEIEILKKGGARHAFILRTLKDMVAPGVTTQMLEDKAREMIEEERDRGAFLNYTPRGAKRAFPAALCVSINNEIVHGIPNENVKTLMEGDVVTLDLGLTHKGLITDSAVTVAVGETGERERKLIAHTEEALARGIKEARGGNHIGDISFAIGSFARSLGYGVPEDLAGHGVGYAVHEDPYVPNEGFKGQGDLLVPGMVLAIEPMLTLGGDQITLASDGYTYKTRDGSIAAHAEHTIVITEGEPIILTK